MEETSYMYTRVLLCASILLSSGCTALYTSPTVSEIPEGSEEAARKGYSVTIIELTPASAQQANTSVAAVASLPPEFDSASVGRAFQVAPGYSAGRGVGQIGRASAPANKSAPMRLPPMQEIQPYYLGVGDVVAITRENATGGVDQLNLRVQDNGAITVPGVGSVPVAELTLDAVREALLRAFVDSGVNPTFALEIVEFNARSASVGGAVATPARVPVTFSPLRLQDAIQEAGGVALADVDDATVFLNRNDDVYTIPLRALYSSGPASKIQLQDGDFVFVDVGLTEEARRRAFDEALELRKIEVENLRIRNEDARAAADNARFQSDRFDRLQSTFLRRLELGAVKREYAYLTGEVNNPLRFPLPFETTASLADILHENRGISIITGDYEEIYLIRTAPSDMTKVSAYHLNAANAAGMALATRVALAPNDVVFVAEQPVTTWNRVLSQILPGSAVGAANTVANVSN